MVANVEGSVIRTWRNKGDRYVISGFIDQDGNFRLFRRPHSSNATDMQTTKNDHEGRGSQVENQLNLAIPALKMIAADD